MEKTEITVKVETKKEELLRILFQKGFSPIGGDVLLEDTYFIPQDLDITKMNPRDVLAKAILIRCIYEDNEYKIRIAYKIKDIDKKGDILNQQTLNCTILDYNDGKNLLEAIGYKELMVIVENDHFYVDHEGNQIVVKDIRNGGILIEVGENDRLSDIDKLKEYINSFKLPIKKNEYFVKKAEEELMKLI